MLRRLVFATLFASLHAFAAAPALRDGGVELSWLGDDPDGYTPRLVSEDRVATATAAFILKVAADASPDAVRMVSSYHTITREGKSLKAISTIRTPGGSQFEAADVWSIDGGIRVERTITVKRADARDQAYGSEIEFIVPGVTKLADADVFIPGLWYATADHTPKSGLIKDLGQRDFILREDRMPLPLVSVRDRTGGTTLTLEHLAPDGATIGGDDDLKRVVDDRLRFGSLGVRRTNEAVRLVFRFPGSEGEQTGIFGYKPDLRTVERLHPIKAGATQRYTLRLSLDTRPSFPAQMTSAWRRAFASAKPAIISANIQAVYDASISVLDHYWYQQGDVAGIPFGVSLPEGEVKDPSLQMGFVGQQLPCASYLIDEGLRSNRPELVEKGEAIVDFWVKNSINEHGVPRTWFDLTPEPRWRNYNTFLRVATDGTSGMLRAWRIERVAGREKPAWLAFVQRVGDWLLSIQNEDGSFYREWKFDGTPASKSKTSTLHPVRLLVDLSCATGERKYRDAALRAAEFALKANASGAAYVGGTPDNPDVVDKEAGWIAMDSCLALYDVTREKKWLSAALDAAAFTETWIYGWNVPLPSDKENVGVPRVETFAGANLIATGHSGADNFLAFASFAYARLWIYTGDEHWLDIARLLQHNSAQFIETGKGDNALGYAMPGLQVEAFSLAVNRGHSVRIWLPWLTSATLEPMARMREAFGVIDVNALRKIDPMERARRNAEWSTMRGMK